MCLCAWGGGDKGKGKCSLNSLRPHWGVKGMCAVLKCLTCCLGDGEWPKVSRQDSDTVRTRAKEAHSHGSVKKQMEKLF